MSTSLEEIRQQALALPADQRAQLVDRLWDSLADTSDPPLSEEWKAEIERRRQEMLEGKVKAVPGPEVSRKARALAQSKR